MHVGHHVLALDGNAQNAFIHFRSYTMTMTEEQRGQKKDTIESDKLWLIDMVIDAGMEYRDRGPLASVAPSRDDLPASQQSTLLLPTSVIFHFIHTHYEAHTIFVGMYGRHKGSQADK